MLRAPVTEAIIRSSSESPLSSKREGNSSRRKHNQSPSAELDFYLWTEKEPCAWVLLLYLLARDRDLEQKASRRKTDALTSYHIIILTSKESKALHTASP